MVRPGEDLPETVPFKVATGRLPSVVSARDGAPSLRLLGCSASRSARRLPSFGLSCGGASIHLPSFAAALLVCVSPLVAAHQAPIRPLAAASRLHAWPRLAVTFHACDLSHRAPWAPMPRVLQRWLSRPCQLARCRRYPRPGQL